MRGKVKNEKTKNKTQAKNDFEFVGLHKTRCRQWPTQTPGTKNLIPAYENTTVIVFAFDLLSTLASHLASTVIMGFLCQHV